MHKDLCIFLDRDGTIMADKHYLSDPAGVELLPGAAEGLRLLQQAGCTLAVLTNQSGIGRGYFDTAALKAVHARLTALLAAENVHLAGIWHCPHTPEAACTCRKPAPGMAQAAAHALGLDEALRAGRVVSVGDKWCDVELGQHLGGRGVLLLTGKGQQQLAEQSCPNAQKYLADFVAADMLDAARWIVHTHAI